MALMESKYRVEKCIGRGNYGTVYLVRSIAWVTVLAFTRARFLNIYGSGGGLIFGWIFLNAFFQFWLKISACR